MINEFYNSEVVEIRKSNYDFNIMFLIIKYGNNYIT